MYCLQTDNIFLLYSRCFTSLQKIEDQEQIPGEHLFLKRLEGLCY